MLPLSESVKWWSGGVASLKIFENAICNLVHFDNLPGQIFVNPEKYRIYTTLLQNYSIFQDRQKTYSIIQDITSSPEVCI